MPNLSVVAPRVHYVPNKYDVNITGHTGDIRILINDIDEKRELPDSSLVRSLTAAVTIQDETSNGDGWMVDLDGVYYPQLGSLLLTTSGEKFAGYFALPHFSLSKTMFALSQQLIDQTLEELIKKQETFSENEGSPLTSSEPIDAMFSVPRCELVMYLQQYPTKLSAGEMRAVEQELRFPKGAPLPNVPPIKMSAIIFSPDCGFVLESKGPPDFAPQEGLHLNGKKREAFIIGARRDVVIFVALLCTQTFLWSRQIKDASTPSSKTRISFHSVGLMAVGDCVALYMSLFLAMYPLYTEVIFLPLVTASFFLWICLHYLTIDFMLDISAVQAPERQGRENQRLQEGEQLDAATTSTAPSTSSTAPTTSARIDTLPLPVTAPRPADVARASVSVPPDQDGNAGLLGPPTHTAPQAAVGSAAFERLNFSAKFYLSCFGLLCVILFINNGPLSLRSVCANVLAVVYFSFWIPQIFRNILRNCRKALSWKFVIGQSVLRLSTMVYFYMVSDNFLFVRNDINAACFLVGWVWIQVCALVSQEVLGPRFFIPQGWTPVVYDYHPILHEEDEEAGPTMPIGFSPVTATASVKPGESKVKGKRVFDCAICTEAIEVPVLPSGKEVDRYNTSSSASTMVFSRRAYMVTPCRHIFHSQCLEGWMRYRLQCPICRENLPPI